MAKDDTVLSTEELHSAIDTLSRLLSLEDLDRLQPSRPHTVYTTLVTLWMLTLQRLGGGKSLEAVVKDVKSSCAHILPKNNKRVVEESLSLSSAGYSKARVRLELTTVEYFAHCVSNSLIELSTPAFEGRRAFIMDGTTTTLEPTPELQRAFPPATNQHGESVWPVAMIMVAHEAQTGCAIAPEIGAMYGEHRTSEAEQAKAIAKRIPQGAIVMADAGFGIFGVAYNVVYSGHSILFRLTKSRFKSLSRRGELIEESEGRYSYRVHWEPSAKDRKSHPELPTDASLDVFLHQVPLKNGESLYLVTTLPISGELAGQYYSRRYDVEHDIRDIKVTLDTENIRAQSVDMVKKELLTSIVAYNLVVQFRRQAAILANVLPRELSFTRVWDTLQAFVISKAPTDLDSWRENYKKALQLTAKYGKLPKRKSPRNSPRKAHPRRPKSTKFMQLKSNEKTDKLPPEKPK